MWVKKWWTVSLSIICLILLLSDISVAQSERLYTLLLQKKEMINENLVVAKEKYPFLISMFENEHIAVYAGGETDGIILNDGTIEEIIPNIPEKTTVEIFSDAQTIENIRTIDDFLAAWSKGKIKVIFRNPILDHPLASTAGFAAGIFIFGFFHYFTGNYYGNKKFLLSLFGMFGVTKNKKRPGVESEISTERMLFFLGWEGKGYKPKNNYARLLIGHSYVFKCTFTPLKDFKEVKIRMRYDETKLKIDCTEFTVGLPESKTCLISPKTEGLPEMQMEATDFILMDAEWKDGVKEEGIIKIPIVINRNVWDGVSYTAGNAIKWAGGITTAVIAIASFINPLIQYFILPLIKS